MNSEDITIKQILGALKPKHLVTIITTTFGAIFVIASGSFWAGQKMAEAQALAQTADLKAKVSQIQAKFEVAQSNAERMEYALQQSKVGYEKSQELLTQKSNEVAQLSTELGRASNCAFVQKQIIETRKEIDSALNPWVKPDGKDQEEKQQNRVSELEKRLALYQQQLSSCGR
jgi:phage-related tail protein